jgi:hypothetical protein
MLSRRELIGKAAVGAAAALAVGGVGTAAVAATRPLTDSTDTPAGPQHQQDAKDGSSTPQSSAETSAQAPWQLVAPFAAGSVVANDWRLVDLTPVRDGSAVATLQNANGRAHRIHLCRNDGSPQGIIHTQRVDLVVMNQGYGERPTEEHFGQAVAALAHAVAANEATMATDVLAGFLPHAERVERFAMAEGPLADGKLR